MRRAALRQEDGYQAGRSRPAAPQASPGSSSTGASSSATAITSPARPAPVPGPPSSRAAGDVRGGAAQDARRPAPSASASASGAMNCWPSRSTANPGQNPPRDRSRSRPGTVAPRLAMTSPATAAAPSPGQRCRRSPNATYPAAAASTRASHRTDHHPPYPAGTAWAFHIPPSITRLPSVPNGVSARAVNVAIPAGSAYTARARDGISHGRLRSRPQGVPARVVKLAIPTRSAYTPRARDGISYGRLLTLSSQGAATT